MEILRVAQFINRLRPDGGAEKLLITKAKAMAGQRTVLTVITTHRHTNCPDMVRQLSELEVDVIAFPARKIISIQRLIKLINYLKRERFDVIHTHLTGATILGAIAGRACGIPVVTTLHNTDMASQDHFYQGRLESWLLKHWVAELIAVGDKTAMAHQYRVGGRHISVISNAVSAAPVLDNKLRVSVRREMTGKKPGPILICVGRLAQQKGYPDLLEAFSAVLQHYDEARLVIVGRGPLESEIREKIRALGLEDNVTMLGLRSDVPVLFAASDIYVSASHWEGLPVAMLEAMAASLPVVATRVGNVPDVLKDGGGCLVDPENPAQLAEAIVMLLEDKKSQQQLGAAGKAVIEKRYNALAWAERLCDVYERASGRQVTDSLMCDKAPGAKV